VGNAPHKPDATLAKPWPIRSWSWSQRLPLRSLSTLALDAVSKKLTNVMTKVGSTNCLNTSQPITLGTNNAGKPWGNAPTTAVPDASSPNVQLAPAAPSTTTNTVGKVGRQRRANSSNTKVTTPKSMLAQSMPAPVSSVDHPFVKPNNAGICDEMMSTPAPCVKAINTGELTKFSNQPKRAKPNTTCSKPVISESHTVRLIHSALPGAAIPLSEAAIKMDVSAVGPTDKRGEALNSTATNAGNSEA
jgi:hypothetical protein